MMRSLTRTIFVLHFLITNQLFLVVDGLIPPPFKLVSQSFWDPAIKMVPNAVPDGMFSINDKEYTNSLIKSGYVLNEPNNKANSSLQITQVYTAEIENLSSNFESFESDEFSSSSDSSKGNATNVIQKVTRRKRKGHALIKPKLKKSSLSSHFQMEYSEYVSENDLVLLDVVRKPNMQSISRAFHLAGPRKSLHFDPSQVNAAIVTCGGLCPGLNNVIRELVHSLNYLYNVNNIWGVTGGFHGFHTSSSTTTLYKPVLLTNEAVENIHHEGGTILSSARGGFDIDKIISFLKEKHISQLYVIGGDGTHRGAYAIHQECMKREMNVAVAGIPKTIDNDVDYLDRSFGFTTAVEAAQAAIRTAKTEAMCNVPNGIGIVKLMGRSAGFLAAFASLGSGDVDLVLIPEVPIELNGPKGILPYLHQRVKEHGFAVVVVAEGSGEEILGVSNELDAGGNRAKPKIGEFITNEIKNYFQGLGDEATIKYIDPSYTVRSVPANAFDATYCIQLAQNAVHGAFAGYTGFSIGRINNKLVYIPIPLLVQSSPRTMSPYGTIWQNCVAMTGQPNTAPPKNHNNMII